MNFDFETITDEERESVKQGIIEAGGVVDESTDEMIDNMIPIVKMLSLDDELFEQIRPLFEESIIGGFTRDDYKNVLREAINQDETFDKDETINQFTTFFSTILYATNSNGGSESKQAFVEKIIRAYTDSLDSVIKDMDIISIPIELISEDGRMPQFANEGDAGADLYSTVEMDLNPGEQTIIPLGFKVQLPEGYAMLIQPRSGQSAKTKLRICNTPGLIDSGYRGEVGVLVENIEPPIRGIDSHYVESGKLIIDAIDYGTTLHIDKGMKLAQARIVRVPKVTYNQTDYVNENTMRGTGGFGSTGIY